jgi:DNA-binding transcriptional LysR family regulator
MIASRPSQAPGLAPMNFRSVEEKLEAVAAGRGVSVLPESTARYYHRTDITYSSDHRYPRQRSTGCLDDQSP